MKGFVESRIYNAVRGLLTGRVNEILGELEFPIPPIEFGDTGSGFAVTPVITLSGCERTEKERVIQLDAYSLTVTFNQKEEHEDGQLYSYAYSDAFAKALGEDITLGGVIDRAVITGKKYIPPKMPHCGEGWGVVIGLRISIENQRPC